MISVDVVWTAEFAAKGYVVALPPDSSRPRACLHADGRRGDLLQQAVRLPEHLRRRPALLPQGPAGQVRPAAADHLRRDEGGLRQDPGWRERLQARCFAGQYNKYEGLTVNFDEAVHGAGGVIVGDDGKPNVATPEATKGLQTLTDWFKDGYIPKAAITWQEEQGRQAFQNGKLIFHRNWGYVYNLAQQDRRLVQDRGQVRRGAAAGHHRSWRLQPGWSQLRHRQVRREQGHRAGLPEVHVLAGGAEVQHAGDVATRRSSSRCTAIPTW